MQNKKKAITLVEVLVSIFLIAVIITAILKIQTNNIVSIERFKNTTLYNGYISLVCNFDNKTDKIYLYDMVKFDDDEIRKEFKEIKILVKNTQDKDILLPPNEYIKVAHITKMSYSITNKIKKDFFKFSLDNIGKQ